MTSCCFLGDDGSGIALMGLPMMNYSEVRARGSLMSVDGAVGVRKTKKALH